MSAHSAQLVPFPAEDCVFCGIAANVVPARVVREWPDAVAFLPRRSFPTEHVLVIPRVHVVDATVDPVVTGMVFARAAELARPACNLITSAGVEAEQTVFHLHVHVVARVAADGLRLPWTGQAPL